MAADSSDRCLICGSQAIEVFHEVRDAPAHSVRLIRSRDEALGFPTRPIRLGLCRECNSVTNVAFDPDVVSYAADYEETQSFSPTFSAFHRRLAEDLITRHDLRAKRILEIGCGKGDFLALLCQLGGNEGVGFDPAFVPERNPDPTGRARYVTELYGARHGHLDVDFVCCKMTLEHIAHASDFVLTIRQALMERPDTTVFFMVPNAGLLLRSGAFWDVYYEHCHYFTNASLRQLFVGAGFEVTGIDTVYEAQYLTVEARIAPGGVPTGPLAETDRDEAVELCRAFAAESRRKIEAWDRLLQSRRPSDRATVLWGAGSKAVGFLSGCRADDRIDYAIDINPFKSGTFLPGSGIEVHLPDEARLRPPHLVVVMNPVYVSEISSELARMELNVEVRALK